MATYSNLFVDQGSDFSFTLNLESAIGSLDLTNYSARGQIKRNYAATTAVAFDLSINTSENSIIVKLYAAQTRAMKATRYVYDIEVYSSDSPEKVIRVLEGQLEVTPGVTVG